MVVPPSKSSKRPSLTDWMVVMATIETLAMACPKPRGGPTDIKSYTKSPTNPWLQFAPPSIAPEPYATATGQRPLFDDDAVPQAGDDELSHTALDEVSGLYEPKTQSPLSALARLPHCGNAH